MRVARIALHKVRTTDTLTTTTLQSGRQTHASKTCRMQFDYRTLIFSTQLLLHLSLLETSDLNSYTSLILLLSAMTLAPGPDLRDVFTTNLYRFYLVSTQSYFVGTCLDANPYYCRHTSADLEVRLISFHHLTPPSTVLQYSDTNPEISSVSPLLFRPPSTVSLHHQRLIFWGWRPPWHTPSPNTSSSSQSFHLHPPPAHITISSTPALSATNMAIP